jgi:hypothetical protein
MRFGGAVFSHGALFTLPGTPGVAMSADGPFVMSCMDLHSVGWSNLSTVQTTWRVDRYNLLVWLTRKIPDSSVGA